MLSISRAWDETKAVFRNDGGLITAVALALFVLPGVVSDMATPPAPEGQMPSAGAWMVVSGLSLLIGLVGQIAVARLALGPRLTVGEAIREGARRALPYIAAAILWLLPFLIAIALLMQGVDPTGATPPPAGRLLALLVVMALLLFVAVRLMLAPVVAAAERTGPLGILRRSWELTQGHWLKLFGFLLLFIVTLAILLLAVGAVVGTVAALIGGQTEPMSVAALLLSLASQIAGAAVTAFLMVMLARIYAQLTSRDEVEATVPHAP